MRPIIEDAIGTKDGVNTTFSTTYVYTDSTVFVFRNGQLQQKSFVTELGIRQFQLADAPESYEDIQVRYLTLS